MTEETTLLAHSGRAATFNPDDVAELRNRLRGRIIEPSDDEYDTARAVWNGMIDKRPGLIARCAGVADVIAAVQFARSHELLVSVRAGGHNVSGNAVCDDGLVIDLSAMQGIWVDPAQRTVRAQGGVTIGDLDRETQAFGLAVPMGLVTETGIAGLTLGGGLGWLRRKHGLSSDNLISADLVTADGTVVTASADHNADLFWAIQGGGGNFGIVTSFEFRAHPVGPDVHLAFVVHPYEDAADALRFYRDWVAQTPDEVSSLAILWHAPAIDEIPAARHGAPIVVFLAMYAGAPTEGEQALRPLREFGTPIADLSDTMPYLDVQRFFDADYPAHEMRYYWKSSYVHGLPDQLIDTLIQRNAANPSPHSTIDIWQLGGAVARVGPEDTAMGDRSAPFLIGIESNWEDAGDDAAGLSWGRTAHADLAEFSTGATYLNFPGLYEDADQLVRDTFGINLERLTTIKRKYDPTNFFRLNQNIRP